MKRNLIVWWGGGGGPHQGGRHQESSDQSQTVCWLKMAAPRIQLPVPRACLQHMQENVYGSPTNRLFPDTDHRRPPDKPQTSSHLRSQQRS